MNTWNIKYIYIALLGLTIQSFSQGDNAVINVISDSNKTERSFDPKKHTSTASTKISLKNQFISLQKEFITQHEYLVQKIDESKTENKKLLTQIRSLGLRLDNKDLKENRSELNIMSNVIKEPKKPSKHLGRHSLTQEYMINKTITSIYDDSDIGESNTFESYPSSQIPLSLLKNKQVFGDQALVFGGYIEIDATQSWGDRFTAETGGHRATGSYYSGINLNTTTINLDVMSNINHWTQTFLTISSFDLTLPFIQNIFVTFGNLEESPLFLSVGQTRVPLGRYAGGAPLMSGMTAGYFRPLWFPNILLGYNNNNFSTNIAVFAPGENSNELGGDGNFMYSAFFNENIPDTDILYGINGGYLYSFANTGMSANDEAVDDPITGQLSLQPRQDRNSVLNFENFISYENYALFSGWSGLTMAKDYTNNDLAGSWYLQATYSPIILNQITTMGLSYNGAYNTQNFFFPLAGRAGFGLAVQGVQKQFIAFIQRPFITQQVLIGLEYAWLGLYNNQQTHEVTLDLSVYF